MSDDAGSDETANAMRDRVRGGRPVLWFLVEGNRIAVAGLLVASAYTTLVFLGQFGPGSVTKLFGPEPIFALFTPIVIVIVMGVSLVLTFNQLVLSEELGPVGDQRERMAGALAFQRDVEDAVDRGTSPPEPSNFLSGLVERTGQRAQDLLEMLETVDSAPQEVIDYAEDVVADADRVSDDLRGTQFGTFRVVKSALNFNYSWKIYVGRRIRERHADSLSNEAVEALDDVLEVLEFFGPAREHFKTLYFRWEIINISRALVYVSLPALAVAAYMILIFETNDVAGTMAGLDNGLLVVGAAFAVGVTPFAIFLSYILRIVTVAKWTLAIGPFILRETERGSDVDWE